jgi:hypothetical protein
MSGVEMTGIEGIDVRVAQTVISEGSRSRFLRFVLNASLYLIPAEAGNRHTLPTAPFAADDPYRANRHVKEITEEYFQGVIGSVVDRGGSQPDEQRAVSHAAKRGLPSAGNHADVDLDPRGGLADH